MWLSCLSAAVLMITQTEVREREGWHKLAEVTDR